MTPRQFMSLFGIKAGLLCKREDKERWLNVVNQYERFPYDKVKDELWALVRRVGKDKPRLYYAEAVRRILLDNEHQSYKTQGMAQSVRDVMKSMFNSK